MPNCSAHKAQERFTSSINCNIEHSDLPIKIREYSEINCFFEKSHKNGAKLQSSYTRKIFILSIKCWCDPYSEGYEQNSKVTYNETHTRFDNPAQHR